MPGRAATTERAGAAGIFLHAGWRSCGTWIWERLRENAGVQAFYEPLHEDLAHLRARDISLLRPDSWQSGHGVGEPYFAEYAPLLGPGGGVRGHAARFAFDAYFRPAEEADAALEFYLKRLIADATANHRLPVLKFCRSLGRVSWLEERFPDMHHAVILRDPRAQWRSARRQMTQNGNRYFVVAPFVILARNADNALLAEAAGRLGVKLPPQLGRSLVRDLSVTTDACWRHVSRLTWQNRFRCFLALWVTSGMAALQGSATVIDSDRLSTDPELRRAAEAALARAAGVPVDLQPDRSSGSEAHSDEGEGADACAAMTVALEFLHDHATGLKPERAAVLASKLQPGNPQSGYPQDGISAPQGAVPPGRLAYADAAAYVAMMRMTYPLRRAHYHARRWMRGGRLGEQAEPQAR